MLLMLLAAATVSTAPAAEPTLRVSGAGLDLSAPNDAATFASRVAVEAERFCASHRGMVTPTHIGDARVCERAMAREVVTRLTNAQWRAFARAGGMTRLRRLQA